MSSKAYIGGDPLPRPDISDRGERGTPIKSKAHTKRAVAHKPAPKPAQTAKAAPDPKPKANYRAPDNYSTYGRPGTNDMGPSSPPKSKTISLGKLPLATVGDTPSTGTSDFASRFPSSTPKSTTKSDPDSDPGLPEETGIVPIPPASTKQASSKHAYKVKWS